MVKELKACLDENKLFLGSFDQNLGSAIQASSQLSNEQKNELMAELSCQEDKMFRAMEVIPGEEVEGSGIWFGVKLGSWKQNEVIQHAMEEFAKYEDHLFNQ